VPTLQVVITEEEGEPVVLDERELTVTEAEGEAVPTMECPICHKQIDVDPTAADAFVTHWQLAGHRLA
jgi:hypothetical protein